MAKTRKYKKSRVAKRRFTGKEEIARVVNKMLKSKIETKQSTHTTADGAEIFHNNFTPLETASTFFSTTQGTQDPMNASETETQLFSVNV